MKLLLLIFSLSCSVALGQISIQELISVSKMDSESFEIYALKKGFNFYRLKNDEHTKGIGMQQFISEKEITRYLFCYSKFFDVRYHSNYQTSQTNELQKLYQDLGLLGFKLVDRREFEDRYVKSYSRGNETVSIHIYHDWIEVGYTIE
jgi:hypothetical protein